MTYTLIIAGWIFATGLPVEVCTALQVQAVYELGEVRADTIICTPERKA